MAFANFLRPGRFDVAEGGDEESAPQLPFGYPIMVVFSLIPFLWRRVMNPKVIKWREQFYPEVKEWESLRLDD